MIYGIGTDIVEVERIKNSIENYGQRFLNKIFTQFEIDYCELFGDNKYVHYAARFAAKESFSKAIGTGITKGFKFKEVGIRNEKSGKPNIILDGLLNEKYEQYNIDVSLSHTDNNAIAIVIMEN